MELGQLLRRFHDATATFDGRLATGWSQEWSDPAGGPVICHNESTKTIAEELVVSHNTARTHIQNVLTKLQVHSRLEASARAVREQLV